MAKKDRESAEDIARKIVYEDSSWYSDDDIDKLGAKGIDVETLAELITQAIEDDRKDR
jgi:hypothetical protein